MCVIGGFDIQLSRLYPQLKFVVQDRGPNLEHAKQTIWPKEAPEALEQGRVTFMEHDFFQPNPVRDAEVYWLRYIMYGLVSLSPSLSSLLVAYMLNITRPTDMTGPTNTA